jgi:hypothetical protein
MGEVFQEVKFWRWLMNIRTLKVLVFRQFFLILLHMIRWHMLHTIVVLKLWAQNLCRSSKATAIAHRVDKITPAPPPLTLSPSFWVTTQRIQS